MNRLATNAIRYVMDELLPPVIRDSRLFMYPFYWIAYRGKNIRRVMDFKREVYAYTPEEYRAFYEGLHSISRSRPTDLTRKCSRAILDEIDEEDREILDVGCGSGQLLREIGRRFPDRGLTGVDVAAPRRPIGEGITFIHSDIGSYDFGSARWDVVLCCHLLEHVVDYRDTLRRLVRAARRKVILVVPIQRPYRYTLDEHINFFVFPEQFAHEVGLRDFRWQRLGGDLFYVGRRD